MVKHGKRYQEAVALADRDQTYEPAAAVALVKQTASTKFDETVEMHLRTAADPRHADQQIRGVALLPHGLGRAIRVLVFAQGEAVRIAESAGADSVGGDELIKKIEDGWLDFDTAIATPDMMSRIGKLGKILGRKGLMPNPKSGTVVNANDLPQAIEEAHKGQVEFKLDRTAIIHVTLGKVSFEDEKLMDNLTAVIEAIVKAKPSGVKGQYVRTASLVTTMGPGIELDLKPTLELSAS